MNIDHIQANQWFQFMRFTSAILIGILLVKWGFDPGQIAQYEYWIFAGNMVSFFFSMGLKNGLLIYYPKLAKDSNQSFFFNIFLLLAFLSLLLVVALILFRLFFWAGSDGLLLAEHFPLLLIFVGLSLPAILIESIYIIKREGKKLLRYSSVIYLIQLTLVLMSLSQNPSIYGLLLALVLWAGIRFIWLILLLNYESRLDFKPFLAKGLFVFSIPLILQIILGNGVEFIDGLLVTHYFSAADFTFFRFGAKELPLTVILIGGFVTGALPDVSRSLPESLTFVRSRTRSLMNWLFPISILLILISPFLFQFFYNESYKLSAQIFNIYILIIISRVLMPQLILLGNHKNYVLLSITFIELILNVLASLILLSFFGLLGIAYGTVIAFLLSKMAMIFYNSWILKVPFREYCDVKVYLLWSIALLCTYYLSITFL